MARSVVFLDPMRDDWSAALPDDPVSTHAAAPHARARIRWGEGVLTVGEVQIVPADPAIATTSLCDLARRMRSSGGGSVPVVDAEGRLYGMVFIDDLLRRVAEDALSATARDILSITVVPACRPEATLLDAIRQMVSCYLMRLPVVDRESYLLGALELGEAVRHAHDDPAVRDLMISLAQSPSLWARRWR